MSCFFPNSLELERRLRKLGADPVLLEDAFVMLERFKVRFRDEAYMLMAREQIDADDLALTLAHATGTPVGTLLFLSNEVCRSMPRSEHYLIYQISRASSIRHVLSTPELVAFGNAREGGRQMVDVIKGAIGTRRLVPALDYTFGNSFASVLKRDIVAVWVAYFHAFVPQAGNPVANKERIRWRGKLVEYLTKALASAYVLKGAPSWIVYTA